MKNLVPLILAGMVFVLTQTGCATRVAMSMPGPSKDKDVQVGMHRQEVESLLGVGAVSQYDDNGHTSVRYEYADGPPQATKLRSLIYVGADVFTIFLSEIIFWPIELYADKQIQRFGTAEYEENRLIGWTVRRVSGGEVLDQLGGPTHEQAEIGSSRPLGEPAVSAPPAEHLVADENDQLPVP